MDYRELLHGLKPRECVVIADNLGYKEYNSFRASVSRIAKNNNSKLQIRRSTHGIIITNRGKRTISVRGHYPYAHLPRKQQLVNAVLDNLYLRDGKVYHRKCRGNAKTNSRAGSKSNQYRDISVLGTTLHLRDVIFILENKRFPTKENGHRVWHMSDEQKEGAKKNCRIPLLF